MMSPGNHPLVLWYTTGLMKIEMRCSFFKGKKTVRLIIGININRFWDDCRVIQWVVASHSGLGWCECHQVITQWERPPEIDVKPLYVSYEAGSLTWRRYMPEVIWCASFLVPIFHRYCIESWCASSFLRIFKTAMFLARGSIRARQISSEYRFEPLKEDYDCHEEQNKRQMQWCAYDIWIPPYLLCRVHGREGRFTVLAFHDWWFHAMRHVFKHLALPHAIFQ